MSEIKPALSEQEWRLFKLWRAGKMLGGHVPVYRTIEEWPDHIKHAGAAQCLYGQSFGFTQADVKLLSEEGWLLLDEGAINARRRMLFDIANRIAALLPPEEAA